jgi:3-dehydroquinate dehydratase-2
MRWRAELGAELAILQSNHEGALIDFMQQHIDSADGAILNPGGLTQHGISTHDCIKAMPFPVIEVHLSNLATREEWRHRSIISRRSRARCRAWAGAPIPRRCARSSRSWKEAKG